MIASDQEVQDKANMDVYKSDYVDSTFCLFSPQISSPPSSYLGLVHSLTSENRLRTFCCCVPFT